MLNGGRQTLDARNEHPCEKYVRNTNKFVILVLIGSALLMAFIALYSCRNGESRQAPVLLQIR
jgi:hypothetical protein